MITDPYEIKHPKYFVCIMCIGWICVAHRDLLSILLNSKKELSQISRTTRQNIIKIYENLSQGNSNHHERFQCERVNISAR